METREQRTVLILADISGYTKFMVQNQTSAVHGQVVITMLLETILAEVDIPLTLHGIEGDAVFLSAPDPGSETGWQGVLAQVRTKLPRFFDTFLAGIVRAAEITPCECPTCRNVDQLKLKIIVHSGRALYHTIAGLPQVSGTDVILVHRLLKNSVKSGEYLLMTESAYQDLGREMNFAFEPGEETCEGIGDVRTRVHLIDPSKERARDEFYQESESELEAEANGYFRWMIPAMYRALFAYLRHPIVPVAWPRRVAFALRYAVELAATAPIALFKMRRNVRVKRAARAANPG